ncbi:MAG: hypothetical protein U5R48_14355 [Gammaproteobacteria bacterium]|nr:hypothetical protein [Gammaproteobacteria bacterium]
MRPRNWIGTIPCWAAHRCGAGGADRLLHGRLRGPQRRGHGRSQRFVEHPRAVPGGLLAPRGMEAEDYRADPRVRAVVAFAPWGGQHGVWDEAGMAGLAVPTLFVAGSDDDVVGWDPGVRSLFAGATGCERALLVHQLARHNVAPNPAPAAALHASADFAHYAEPLRIPAGSTTSTSTSSGPSSNGIWTASRRRHWT